MIIIMDPNKDDYITNVDRMNSNIDKNLKQALSILHDTQETGIGIMMELDGQRNKINSMRQKNDKINNDISKSNVVLTKMENTERLCIVM